MEDTQTLLRRVEGDVVHVTLNRPHARNAMTFAMVDELIDTLDASAGARALVLRGAGGHFCAGGDLREMAEARTRPVEDQDPLALANRRFGALLEAYEASHVPILAVCEGAVMGGGFGLACIADVTIAVQGARFRLPETSLGLTPAQVAPFIVRRIGWTQARRLLVTGRTVDASRAVALGLAHMDASDVATAELALADELRALRRCAPGATAATKRLMQQVGTMPMPALLDRAAEEFARAARGEEAAAGLQAFLQKSDPPWNVK